MSCTTVRSIAATTSCSSPTTPPLKLAASMSGLAAPASDVRPVRRVPVPDQRRRNPAWRRPDRRAAALRVADHRRRGEDGDARRSPCAAGHSPRPSGEISSSTARATSTPCCGSCPRSCRRATTRASDFGRALLRGRYMAPLAVVENNGVPIDVPLLGSPAGHWKTSSFAWSRPIDADFGVYERPAASSERLFEAYAGAAWHSTGRASSPAPCPGRRHLPPAGARASRDRPVARARHAMGQIATARPGGRARTAATGRSLSAFRAKTGRNQPSNTQVHLRPVGVAARADQAGAGTRHRLRRLVEPGDRHRWPPCRGDARLWAAYASGDPYIAFARQAGLVPADATKNSHPAERAVCKMLFLGIGYGMSAEGMALQSGLHDRRGAQAACGCIARPIRCSGRGRKTTSTAPCSA